MLDKYSYTLFHLCHLHAENMAQQAHCSKEDEGYVEQSWFDLRLEVKHSRPSLDQLLSWFTLASLVLLRT